MAADFMYRKFSCCIFSIGVNENISIHYSVVNYFAIDCRICNIECMAVIYG